MLLKFKLTGVLYFYLLNLASPPGGPEESIRRTLRTSLKGLKQGVTGTELHFQSIVLAAVWKWIVVEKRIRGTESL